MVKITFVGHDGKAYMVDAETGISLMQNAVRSNVPGIDAECGGACSCATCHVYIDEAWREAAGEPEIFEADMMEFASHVEPGSRLSCQIKVTERLEGLVVRIPVTQG